MGRTRTMAIIGRMMPSTMILSIQDQWLRDWRRGELCSAWGGVEEFGEFGHDGGEGSGARRTVFAQTKRIRKMCDFNCVCLMAFGSALCCLMEMLTMERMSLLRDLRGPDPEFSASRRRDRPQGFSNGFFSPRA